jgi:hypothetical protein
MCASADLARGMGGDLRVRSAEGKGSTFTITLRRATNEATVDEKIEDDGQSGARKDLPDHYAPN